LPNVVLFPRAVLPLHIFEERYKAMTEDTLAGDRRIAMALLKPGWEKNYHGKPSIEPVVCVGRILSCEKLADGNFNFLLQGIMRARIVSEKCGRQYRVAQLVRLEEIPAMEIDLDRQRQKLLELFNGSARALPIAEQFRSLLNGPLPMVDIADLVAFNFLEDISLKQELLAEIDARKRVEWIVEAMEVWGASINPGVGFGADPEMN